MFWLGWRFAAPRLGLLGALFRVVCVAGLCLPEVWAVCVHSGAQTKGTAVTWGSFSITTSGKHTVLLRSRLRNVIILLVKARYMMVRNQEIIFCHFFEKAWKITQQRVWTQEVWRTVVKNALCYTLDWISLEEHYLHKERLKCRRKLDSLCVASQSQLVINEYK